MKTIKSTKASYLYGFLALLFLIMSPAHAQQMKNLGPYEVHYMALGTTFLTPEIASTYNIERSRYKGFVNISVLAASEKSRPAQSVKISGQAKNLLGSIVDLNFKEIKEGQAIYYIAGIDYRNEEKFKITVTVNDGNEEYTLEFDQKFYVD